MSRSTETVTFEEGEKRVEKNEKSVRNLWEQFQKVLYTSIYPRRRGKMGQNEIFEYMMTEISPIWWKIYTYRFKKLSKPQTELIPRTHTSTYHSQIKENQRNLIWRGNAARNNKGSFSGRSYTRGKLRSLEMNKSTQNVINDYTIITKSWTTIKEYFIS